MWFFEKNYSHLGTLLPEIIELKSATLIYRDNLKLIKINCLEVSRYTTLISLQLTFKECSQIPIIEMTVRLYHDAEVADVVSYQNLKHLVAPYFSEEKNKAENHKRQANILLNEILMSCVQKQG